MKQVLLGLAACSLSLAVSAQQFHCATDAMRAKLIAEDPTFLEREAAYREEVRELMQSNLVRSNRDVVVTIPIVFHIIHLNGNENISNAQIEDQMRILNEDFQALNTDLSGVHPAFTDIAGNAQIRFVLPTLDPNGNCTNGIDRIRTPETLKGNDESKMNAWPRNKYLNVWVVQDVRGDAAGYAYMPGGMDGLFGRLVDGIILENAYVGSIGTANPNRSRALTHEVGHYLNLHHVWGSNNGEENPPWPHMAQECSDDEVEDTPMSRGWDNYCPPYNDVQNPWTDCSITKRHLSQFPYRFDDVTTTSGTQDPTELTQPSDDFHGGQRVRAEMTVFSANGVSEHSAMDGKFAFTGWDEARVDQATDYAFMTGSINLDKYYTFSLSPKISDMLDIDSLGFRVGRDANGARTFAVRSSVNNFSTNLPIRAGGNPNISIIQPDNIAFFNSDAVIEVPTLYVDPPAVGYRNIEGPISFRIYAWNAENAHGTLRICANDPATDLFDRLGGSPQPGGTWSGPSAVVDDLFDPATMESGTYTYTVAQNGSCAAYSAEVDVTVATPPDVPTITGPSAFCSGTSVTLSSSSATANTWSPGGQTTASITVNRAGTYSVTVSGNGCKATSELLDLVLVNAANAGTDDSVSVCLSGDSIPLFTALGGTPQLGGSWIGPSEVVDGHFHPGSMAPGVYQYVIIGSEPCPNDTANVKVVAAEAAAAGANGILQLCRNAQPVDLYDRLTGKPQTGGTWSGASSIPDGMFDPTHMNGGVYTYTVDPGGDCGTATATVNVILANPPPVPTISVPNGPAAVCIGSTRMLRSSSSTGNRWSPGDQTSQNITVREGGNYTVTVTAGGCSSTSAPFVVTAVPPVNAGGDGILSICSSSEALPLFPVLTGTPDQGGVWSGPSPVSNGEFDPSDMAAGDYKYIMAATSPCLNDTAVITVTETESYSHSSGAFSVDDVRVYGTSSLIENVENFMEYSYCSMMFTGDQVLRMRAALNAPAGDRDQTWTETNLQATGSGEYAVQCPPKADFYARTEPLTVGFQQPVPFSPTLCAGANVHFVDNSGGGTATNWSWTFVGGEPSTSTDRNPVVTFNSSGWKQVSLTVSNANGSHTKTDQYAVNIGGDPYDVTGGLHQSFESGSDLFPWFNMNYANNVTFFQRTTAAATHGSACAMLNSGVRNHLDLVDPENGLDYDELISPNLDLSSLESGTTFSFDYAYATGASDLSLVSEELVVSISTDCGRNWSTMTGGQIRGMELINNGNNPQLPPPAWTTKTLTIPNFRLVPNVRIRFRYISSIYSGNLYIDNIRVSGPVSVENLSMEHFMNLYPNPTNDRFSLTVFGMDRFNTDIVVTDVRGAIVYRTTHRPVGTSGMEFSGRELGLTDGLYLIRATNEAGDHTQRMVISK